MQAQSAEDLARIDYEAARIALEGGSGAVALEKLESVMATLGKQPELLSLAAQAAAQAGNEAKAKQYSEEALKLADAAFRQTEAYRRVIAILASQEARAGTAATKGGDYPSGKPRVAIETSLGRIVIELEADKAPKTVDNFLAYVKAGHYDGTVFHRVIPGFMIQGGGLSDDMREKGTRAPIQNEADNGLRNERGTVAMARDSNPNSATAQFFVNTVDNAFLDHKGKNPAGWGYAVFGRVIEGMDVIDRIAAVRTGNRGQFLNVPVETIEIRKAGLL